ncbi:MAG: hypothetical protein U5J95_07720 [Balneolaceae bacterium]|nr:hypothetical protein [Balneolaceae bacterium]
MPLSIPTYILRFWPFIEELPLDTLDKRLPMKLKPNDKVEDVSIRGLTVFKALDEQGLSGDITLMFGFYDKYENAYYGPPFKVQTSELKKDCGNGIWIEWPLSIMWL